MLLPPVCPNPVEPKPLNDPKPVDVFRPVWVAPNGDAVCAVAAVPKPVACG